MVYLSTTVFLAHIIYDFSYGNDAQIIANDVMLSDVGLRLMLREGIFIH